MCWRHRSAVAGDDEAQSAGTTRRAMITSRVQFLPGAMVGTSVRAWTPSSMASAPPFGRLLPPWSALGGSCTGAERRTGRHDIGGARIPGDDEHAEDRPIVSPNLTRDLRFWRFSGS